MDITPASKDRRGGKKEVPTREEKPVYLELLSPKATKANRREPDPPEACAGLRPGGHQGEAALPGSCPQAVPFAAGLLGSETPSSARGGRKAACAAVLAGVRVRLTPRFSPEGGMVSSPGKGGLNRAGWVVLANAVRLRS